MRQRLPSVAVTAGERGNRGVGKSSDGTKMVRTPCALGKGRLFALRTTEQIRHADDDVDDSSRADCHANHGTERPVIDSRRPVSRRSCDSRSHPEGREKTEPSSVDEPQSLFRRRERSG